MTEEVVRGLPAAAVIGAKREEVGVHLQKLFTTPRFRSYTSDDIAGIDEAKRQVFNLVDIMKNPAKYSRLGARQVSPRVEWSPKVEWWSGQTRPASRFMMLFRLRLRLRLGLR